MDAKEAAKEWYRKGTDAMNRQNWDFAVECFSSSLKLAPDMLLYRQTYHGCLKKKFDNNGSGARMSGMKLMPIKGKIKKARMQKKWGDVDLLAEQGLAINPWDAQLYFDLGEASLERDHQEIAVHALSCAVAEDKDNMTYNRKLGNLLAERGDYKAAIECFERVYKADSNDGEARSMINKLRAESTIDRGGYGKAENTQDVRQEPVNAYEMDRQARRGKKETEAPGESEEADLRHAIRKSPNDVNNYLKLATIYRDQRELPKAQELLEKAVEVSQGDQAVKDQLEDVELELMRHETAKAKDKARKNPDSEPLVAKAKTMSQSLLDREIEVMSGRVQRNANDMRLKMELADRYRVSQRWTEAIPLLQQATADTRLRDEALVSLGECFVKDRKLDLGRRQFEKALETISAQDKPDAFKLAHYFLGRLYEKAKKTDQAENHYTEILSVDYEYRDVLKRLETLQGGDEADFE